MNSADNHSTCHLQVLLITSPRKSFWIRGKLGFRWLGNESTYCCWETICCHLPKKTMSHYQCDFILWMYIYISFWKYPRLQESLATVGSMCLDLTQSEMFKLNECFLDVDIKHEMTESHASRTVLRWCQICNQLNVAFAFCLQKHYVILWYFFDWGAAKYSDLHPSWVVADLNQNPEQRPKWGSDTMPTLTTGCSRMRWNLGGRYLHGGELCLLHGIPVTKQIAEIMGCPVVNTNGISHTALCRMAGNSMHAASVGLMILTTFLFVVQNAQGVSN